MEIGASSGFCCDAGRFLRNGRLFQRQRRSLEVELTCFGKVSSTCRAGQKRYTYTFLRFLILRLMSDFGSFRDFATAVGLFNSTALTKHSISLRWRIFALRKIVEKEIDRSNATVPGDDKIGSRVSRWFAGSARYPSNPSGIT
jgi:hypothetical protein